MTPLQWALLILAIAAVLAVYWFSRRDRRAMQRGAEDATAEPLLPSKEQQLDIFGKQFDEFGVGKPRRVAPRADTPFAPSAASERNAPEASAAAPPPAPAGAGGVTGPAASAAGQKIVALLIAEREGRPIPGVRLHAALRSQSLQYGDRQIYHRMAGDRVVFSVASLVKPGYLDPAQAADFTTPGLTLFLVLPGPVAAAEALRDMLDTAQALAAALNAQVYDSQRRPLSDTGVRALTAEVEAWARRPDTR